jgi:hypothetical protein
MELLIADLTGRERPGEQKDDCEHTAFLTKAYYQNPDESQRARLLINGEEVKRGTVEQMKEAYKFQVDINPNANITVQEWQKPIANDKPATFVMILHRGVRILK